MILDLGGNKIGEVAQWLRGIKDLQVLSIIGQVEEKTATYVLHDAHCLFGLGDEFVLGLFDFFLSLRAQLLGLTFLLSGISNLEGRAVRASLDSIKGQACLLDVLACAGREHEVGVQSGCPSVEEVALNLCILSKPGFANTLLSKRVFLESRSEGVFSGTSVLLVQQLAAGETGTSNGVVESLRLRLRRGGGSQGSLCLGRRACRGQKADLFANGAAKVLERLLDVGGVIVGFVGILGSAIIESAFN